MGFKWSDQRNPEIWDSCIAKNNKIWMRKIQKKKKKNQHLDWMTHKNGFCVREEIRLKAWRKAHAQKERKWGERDRERRLQPECILLRKAKIWMKYYYFIFFCFFCFWVNFTFLELVKESVIFMVFLALFFYQKVKKIELFLILVENNFFILSRKWC